MAYNIYKNDGTLLTTIADGGKDTISTGLTLPGPNYVGYGNELNENLLSLLENFASNSAPSSTNIHGQLWFNKSNQTLNVFTDQGYKSVSGVTNSGIQPAVAKDGDIWFNTTTNQTYLYNNSAFNLVGPQYTKAQGIAGAIPLTVQDGFAVGVTHNILQLQFGNVVVATVSADPAFTPTPALSGFPIINPGITISNTVVGATLNSNLVGSVVGNVTGNLVGNVTATTLSGTLTGNVYGNLFGNVIATSLSGSLIGNFSSTTGVSTNFSSGNAVITGGSVTGLNNLTATSGIVNSLSSGILVATNFSSGNAVITGGSLSGITDFNTVNLYSTNFSTANAIINGGSLISINELSATTATATNLSSGNVVITGGVITGVSAVRGGTGFLTNFSTGNAVITGGTLSGITAVGATTVTATSLTATSATFTNGTVSNLTGTNVILTSANLVSAVATTRPFNDNTTAVATTGFVQNVMPAGIIVMWNSSVASIPLGWQLCDGTNNTPDLRGQFIAGAGGAYTPNTTGGNNSITLATANLPAHTHAMILTGNTGSAGGHTHTATSSVTDPGHSHSYLQKTGWTYAQTSGNQYGNPTQTATTTANVTGVTVDTTISAAAAHLHSVTLTGNTSATGSATAIDIRPQYYALCYIQKMY